MGRKRQRVPYALDAEAIRWLSETEIRGILRAADEMIAVGGRSLLCKTLKGSTDKTVLQHELQHCPAYGFYDDLTMDEIMQRIDWAILNGYLRIIYPGRLPVVVFTDRGWEIERETYADELLAQLTSLLEGDDFDFLEQLEERDRGMILLLIEKIKETRDQRFIPLLEAWKAIAYRKVQAALGLAIEALSD